MSVSVASEPVAKARTSMSVEVDQISAGEWALELGRFGDASIYHTWSYGQISWGESNLSHLVLKQDGRIAAMAQVRIVKLPVVPAGIGYVRWGPLFRADGQTDLEVFRAALKALKNEYAGKRGLMLRVIANLYEMDASAEGVLAVLKDEGFATSENQRRYHTMRLDLGPSVEGLRKGLKQRWRNKLKHAEAEGFTVTMGSADDRYAKFHRAYDEMMARKMFETTVSVPEFARLQSALPAASKMQILLCEKEGVLFNALVIAPGGDTGIYLLAATSDAGLAADGAFLLQWRAITWLKEQGYRWYDLGGVNAETNPGVYQFKSGMGGKDTYQVPPFEFCSNGTSAFCVRGGERLSDWVRQMKKRLKAKPAAVVEPAATTNPEGEPKKPE